jgi:hypothetical protein
MLKIIGTSIAALIGVYFLTILMVFIWNFTESKTIKDANFEVEDSFYLFYCYEDEKLCARVSKFKLSGNYTYNEKYEVRFYSSNAFNKVFIIFPVLKKNLPIEMQTSKTICEAVVNGQLCNTKSQVKSSQGFGYLRLKYGNYSKVPGIIEKKDFRRIKM